MAHDTHFLSRLSRVSDADVELAMSLYRDVPSVRELVSTEKLPAEAQRVAIALDASASPPLVLVERDGRFVTCLAAGMKADGVPIISRAALDRHLRIKAEFARIEEGVKELDPELGAFDALMFAAETLDRETFVPLFVTSELLESKYTEILRDKLKSFILDTELLAGRAQARARDEPILKRAWQNGWVAAHLLPFVSHALRERAASDPEAARWLTTALLSAACHGYLPLTLRAMWGFAHVGKPLLPYVKEAFNERVMELPARLALGVLAMSHGKLEAEIRKVLERRGDSKSTGVVEVLDNPGLFLRNARQAADIMGQHVTSGLVSGNAARWNAPDEIPPELILPLVAQFPTTHGRLWVWEITMGALPLVARAAPEDFQVPAAVRRGWRRLDFRTHMGAVIDEMRPHLGPRVARAQPRPGRNDPCSCGSGRKFKKCCGG